MPRFLKPLTLALAVALLFTADWAEARQGGGGGRGGGGGGGRRANNNNDNSDDMTWGGSLTNAIESAKENATPIMAILRRVGNLDDQKAVEKLASWPQVVQLSKEGMVAVRMNAEGTKAAELSSKVKLPSLPYILWLDQYGNPVLGQAMPESAASIVSVVGGWKNTLASVDKFFKDHNGRGEKFLEKGKLRDAYLEFAFGSPFKGPEPERAKAGQQKVRDRWNQLLETAAKFPAESRSRTAVLKGLRKDVQATDYAMVMDDAIQMVGSTQAGAVAAKAAKPASASVAAGMGDAKPAAAMPAVEEKPLAEVLSTRLTSQEQPSEDAGVDTKALAMTNDERLKEADKLMQAGLADFRKACADNTDRGPARNELLRGAHTKFEKALGLMEEGSGGKPDTQVEKLMERTSMLMYGCLKYQSL